MPVTPQTPPGDAPADKPPKRGPGRPKGSKNKVKDPVAEAARNLEGNGDTPPGVGKRKPKRISKKVTEQIEEALAEILCAPSMVTVMFGDQWATEHFTLTGKELAHRIAVTSERHSQLRAWCEKALDSESILVVGLAFAAYTIPPLLHWNIIPGPGADMLGVPRVGRKGRPKRPDSSPTQATEWNEGETEQQAYERAQRQAAAESNGHATEPAPEPQAPQMYAEFSGEDDDGPPTFIETPG